MLGTCFWGLSGTASQALFQLYHFPALGLATIRMIVSGLILLVILRPSLPERKNLRGLLAIAIFGFLGTQVSYLLAIQYTNAPTATLLQFLFLPMVAAYEALTGALRWSKRWSIILGFAGVGTLLLIGVFSGNGFSILITPIGLIAGLLAAAAAAYYSLASRKIVKDKGPWWLLTWGFLIGGLLTSPFGILSLSHYQPPVSTYFQLMAIWELVAFVIIFGTILSFGLYLSGLRHLPATEIGVVASIEPIAASIAAYVFLGNVLQPIQYVGGAIILLAVILTASKPPEAASTRTESELYEGKKG
jgi:drug/metabolite transporter (DMT)-like permease